MTEMALATTQEAAEDIYLGRQPIVDRAQQLQGFELLFRNSLQNRAAVVNDAAATSSVIVHTLAEFGIDTVLGGCTGFINCDTGFLMSDVISLLPHDKVVLEILETTVCNTDVQRRCLELKAMGFRLALDDFQGVTDSNRALLPMMDMIKVDISGLSAGALERVSRDVRMLNATRLAEKVETLAQFQHCHDLGYHLFQGYHFAYPEMVSGRRLSSSHAALLRLVAMLQQDADVRQIENVFKEHPALAVNLLRLANSAAMGHRQPLRSVANAIVVLGRRQLQRWLLLLMLASADAGASGASALLHLAATRGKLMELLMQAEQPALADSAFVTGIVSVMDVLLGQPLRQVVDTLGLADDIRAALLERSGPIGQLLRLAQALESDDDSIVREYIAANASRAALTINHSQGQAMLWASKVLQAA